MSCGCKRGRLHGPSVLYDDGSLECSSCKRDRASPGCKPCYACSHGESDTEALLFENAALKQRAERAEARVLELTKLLADATRVAQTTSEPGVAAERKNGGRDAKSLAQAYAKRNEKEAGCVNGLKRDALRCRPEQEASPSRPDTKLTLSRDSNDFAEVASPKSKGGTFVIARAHEELEEALPSSYEDDDDPNSGSEEDDPISAFNAAMVERRKSRSGPVRRPGDAAALKRPERVERPEAARAEPKAGGAKRRDLPMPPGGEPQGRPDVAAAAAAYHRKRPEGYRPKSDLLQYAQQVALSTGGFDEVNDFHEMMMSLEAGKSQEEAERIVAMNKAKEAAEASSRGGAVPRKVQDVSKRRSVAELAALRQKKPESTGPAAAAAAAQRKVVCFDSSDSDTSSGPREGRRRPRPKTEDFSSLIGEFEQAMADRKKSRHTMHEPRDLKSKRVNSWDQSPAIFPPKARSKPVKEPPVPKTITEHPSGRYIPHFSSTDSVSDTSSEVDDVEALSP